MNGIQTIVAVGRCRAVGWWIEGWWLENVCRRVVVVVEGWWLDADCATAKAASSMV